MRSVPRTLGITTGNGAILTSAAAPCREAKPMKRTHQRRSRGIPKAGALLALLAACSTGSTNQGTASGGATNAAGGPAGSGGGDNGGGGSRASGGAGNGATANG